MSRRMLPVLIAIIALSVVSIPAHAKTNATDTLTFSVRLMANTNAAGTKLAPGKYKVTVEGDKAKFQLGKKVVAEIPCTLKDYPGRVIQTALVTNQNQLTEIQVAGKHKSVEFASGQ